MLEAGAVELDAKVKRVHIGTHGEDVEVRCRRLFTRLGWEKRNDFMAGADVETVYGRIGFQDGVQTWINPRFG